MTVLAALTTDYAWGLLLVADPQSTGEIPEWGSPDDVVTGTSNALVVRVRHRDEGPVAVRVLSDDEPAAGSRVFEGHIELVSGVLRVSDALQEKFVDVATRPGAKPIAVFVDDPSEATVVELIVGGLVHGASEWA